ncbi:DUF2339 domain-containing protein [Chloroflexota bacterium]
MQQCPKCHRNNNTKGKFCIYCGAQLSVAEPEKPPQPSKIPIKSSPPEQRSLQEQIRRLTEALDAVNRRLFQLEAGMGTIPKVDYEAPAEMMPYAETVEVMPTIEAIEAISEEETPAAEISEAVPAVEPLEVISEEEPISEPVGGLPWMEVLPEEEPSLETAGVTSEAEPAAETSEVFPTVEPAEVTPEEEEPTAEPVGAVPDTWADVLPEEEPTAEPVAVAAEASDAAEISWRRERFAPHVLVDDHKPKRSRTNNISLGKIFKIKELEFLWGGNWIAKIGAIAIIIGIAFGIKYAFEHELIAPTGWIAIGILLGIGLLVWGHLWRKKYPVLFQSLSGAGIGILYLSIFSANVIFHLSWMPIEAATILLLLVSVTSAVIAVRADSMALAVIGITGAFMAPFVLGAFALTTTTIDDEDLQTSYMLMVYIVATDIGVLVLSTFRNWRWFILLALSGSLLSYLIWYLYFGSVSGLLMAELSITFIFIIFIGAMVFFQLLQRRPANHFDYILLSANAAAYFGISYALLWGELSRGWIGVFTGALALFYGILSFIAIKRGRENFVLSCFAYAISAVFLTITIPVVLGDKGWTTVGWVAQATVLMWLTFRVKMPLFRIVSYIIFAAVAVRLIFFDTWITPIDFNPLYNDRFLAFAASIAAMYLTGYLIWRNKADLWVREKRAWNIYPVFLVMANVFMLWLICTEVITYKHPLVSAAGWPLGFLLLASAAVTLYHLVWRRLSEDFDLVLLLLNTIVYFAISGVVWAEFRVWMGFSYFMLTLIHAALAYFTHRKNRENYRLTLVVAVLAMVFFTVGLAAWLGDSAWTTIAWSAEAGVMLWISLRIKVPLFQIRGLSVPLLRIFSYIMFAAVAVRLMFFDTTITSVGYVPVYNERFPAFIVSIVIMYLASYLIWRNRAALTSKEMSAWYIYPVFVVLANVFTMWLIIAEVATYNSWLPASEGWPLGFLLLVVGATTLYHLVWRRLPQGFDVAFLVINAVVYFSVSGAVWADFPPWMGFSYFMLALIHAALAFFIHKRGSENFRLTIVAAILAMLFFTVGLAAQFGDSAWTTIAWALEAAVMLWLSLRLNLPLFQIRRFSVPLLRIFSYIMFAAVAVRLMFFDTTISRIGYRPVYNERFLAFVFAIAIIYLAGCLLWKNRESLSPQEKSAWSVYPVFLVMANVFTMWLIIAEVANYNMWLQPAKGWPMGFLLLVVAASSFNHIIGRRTPHRVDAVLLGSNAIVYFSVIGAVWGDFSAWMGFSYFMLATISGALAFLIHRRGENSFRLDLVAALSAMVFFTIALAAQFGDLPWLTTIAWSIEAAVLLWFSFRIKASLFNIPQLVIPLHRVFSYIVFFAVTIRLLVIDMWMVIDGFTVIANERFLVFVFCMASMYFAGYIIRKNKESLSPLGKRLWYTYPIFIGIAIFYSVIALTAELWSGFDTHIVELEKIGIDASWWRNALSLSYSLLWALCAICVIAVGISRRSRPMRVGGLIFLVVPICKVFFYDVWTLTTAFQVGSFIGLGVLLLVGSYLYQRYTDKIKGFFKDN